MRGYRVRAIVLTGIVCVVAAWITPVRSQEQPEVEEAKVEEVQSTLTGKPQAATTTERLDIPTDELKLLVKPLTLAELENEAAAWMLLLKAKATEISRAEIAIKRGNLAITKQEEAAQALEQAQKALEEAEELQKSATPGSPEYEEAAKKVEEAKDNFNKAQEAVEEAQETKEEIEEDATLRNAQEKAKETGNLDLAKQTLKETEKAREEMVAGSLDYEEATKKIDELEAAIKEVEDAKEALEGVEPDSPEYEEATGQLETAQEALKQLLKEQGADTTEQSTQESSENFDQVTADLENTTLDSSGAEKVAGPTEVVDSQENLNQQQEQLEKTTEQLKKNAEAESEAKNQLVATVTELQAQQTSIIDRFNVILDEIEAKGGTVESYRQYITAVSGIEFDVKDAEGLGLRLIGWAQSEEGGMRWVNNTGKFLGVFVVTTIGAQLIGAFVNLSLAQFGGVSVLMRQFLVMLVKRGGVVLGFMLALTALEVSLGPILALLGGVSFVLAFALQSNLGNLASGLMIMAYKPFDVGDEIKAGGLWGWVDSITLANTKIKGFGGQMFNVPNNSIWGDTIENLTHSENRKIKIGLRIALDDSLKKVEPLLLEIMKSHPKVLETPAPSVFVFNIEEYYINVSVSGWATTKDFWGVYSDVVRMLQERFTQEGIKLAAVPKQIYIKEESNGNGKTPHFMSEMSLPHKVDSTSENPPVDSVIDAEGMEPEGIEA